MASSMRGLKNYRCRWLIIGGLVLIASAVTPVIANETGIFIQRAQIDRKDQRHVVTADIEYRFPTVALQALDEGIPLTFRITLQVERISAWGWAETVIQDERTIQLRYQPLAKSFQVSDLGSGAVLHYASLANLLDTLSHLRGWMISELPPPSDDKEKREATLRFKFDVESLPLPLRLVAYLSPDWNMEAPPYRWPLDH